MAVLPAIHATMQAAVEDSLRFTWHDGGRTRVGPQHTTGWRELPFAIVAQPLEAPAVLRLGPRSRQPIRVGEAVFVAARVRHRIDATGGGFVSRWAHVTFTLFGSVDVLSLLNVPHIIEKRTAAQIGDLCERLAAERDRVAEPVVRAARRLAMGFRMLELFASAAQWNRTMFDFLDAAARVLPVLRFLEGNLARTDISRDSLAELIHLSPTRFHSVFTAAIGVAPMRYLKQLRLRRAQHLLAETEAKVAAVGRAVGYADAFHFSRTFKAATGVSPAQYRRSAHASARTGM